MIRSGCAVVMALMASAAFAEDRGHEIAAEADRRANEAVANVQVTATMVLRSDGRESERALELRVLSTPDGDLTRVAIEAPPDLAGTLLLTHGHVDRAEDQWLYLPAVRRARRLAGGGRAGSFLGSEFAYEDFAPRELERFEYRHLREEQLDGVTLDVIEQIPLDRQSGYARLEVWIDRDHFRIHRIDYFDRRETFFKTLRNREFMLHGEQFWRPMVSTMTHHESGRETELRWADFRFNQDRFDEDIFDPARLR